MQVRLIPTMVTWPRDELKLRAWYEPNYLISCLTSNKFEFFAIRDGICSVDKLLSLCRLRLITSVNPSLAELQISARLKVTGLLFSEVSLVGKSKSLLKLMSAEIESSTKPGFKECMSLKGFSPLFLLCWSAIIFANHNLNNIEQNEYAKGWMWLWWWRLLP